MYNIGVYKSLIGDIIIISKNDELIYVQFKDSNIIEEDIFNKVIWYDNKVILETKKWLDSYFKGKKPKINKLKLNLRGTNFQKKVWHIIVTIPYGKTLTYKDIKMLIEQDELTKMSCQAVGQAIAKNPILIIVPCHRVIGQNGKLVGYQGGIKRKQFLLDFENDII